MFYTMHTRHTVYIYIITVQGVSNLARFRRNRACDALSSNNPVHTRV